MKKIVDYICHNLTSKKTWERAWYFTRAKDPGEGNKKLTKDDIFPLILSFVVYIGLAFVFAIFFKMIGSLLKR